MTDSNQDTSWWCQQMEAISMLLAFCVGNSPVTGEFPAQKPVMGNFDVFFDLHLNKRLNKQSSRQWFEMPSCPLWCHCNVKQCHKEYWYWILQWVKETCWVQMIDITCQMVWSYVIQVVPMWLPGTVLPKFESEYEHLHKRKCTWISHLELCAISPPPPPPPPPPPLQRVILYYASMLYHFESESHMQTFPTTSYHTILCCEGVNDCLGHYNGDIILQFYSVWE